MYVYTCMYVHVRAQYFRGMHSKYIYDRDQLRYIYVSNVIKHMAIMD